MRVIQGVCITMLCLTAAACASSSAVVNKNDEVYITLHTQRTTKPIQIAVEIADTPLKQANGLMNRTNLPDNTGMLFVFSNEADRTFWMKDTLIPLDIIYFDAMKTAVSMYTMTPCIQDPCTRYPAKQAIMYALEVPAGFIQKYDIQVGDTFTHQ